MPALKHLLLYFILFIVIYSCRYDDDSKQNYLTLKNKENIQIHNTYNTQYEKTNEEKVLHTFRIRNAKSSRCLTYKENILIFKICDLQKKSQYFIYIPNDKTLRNSENINVPIISDVIFDYSSKHVILESTNLCLEDKLYDDNRAMWKQCNISKETQKFTIETFL